MSLNAFCQLSIDGTALSGDVITSAIGGVDVSSDHIEAMEVRFGADSGSTGDARRSGRRRIAPVRIMKRIDQTTPLLYQALSRNQRVEGDIKLFDTAPDSGETRHRFTVRIERGRLVSIASTLPDTLDAENANRPPTEVLEIVPHTIAYVDEVHGVEFEDTAGQVTALGLRPTLPRPVR